jgi:hypothetical protein
VEVTLAIVTFLCYLIGAIGGVWLLVEAFKVSTRMGVRVAFVAPYAFYFAFAKFRHPRKSLILGLWLIGGCAGIILNIILAAKYD